ncbi:hypothetical protein HBI53_230960 [Parastagonospora nodorum]|nr:hypothetical protein HBI53_230960 [Parastagonospora nodorum]
MLDGQQTICLSAGIFETVGERFVSTTNQVAAEVRFYCDNDECGDGKRWTLTPNDPDDPVYVRNDQLPRLPSPGEKVEEQPLQQWQDETNWVRQSRGSMGCAGPGTQAETYTRKFSSERSPSGMNANRATITICDSSLLSSELVTPDFLKFSSFKGLDSDFASRRPFAEFTTYGKQVVFLDIFARTDDVTYDWKLTVTQSAEKAIRNAETFVMYAMFSRAADKGYRLRMDGADDATKLKMINRAEIFYNQNLERVGGEQDTPF